MDSDWSQLRRLESSRIRSNSSSYLFQTQQFLQFHSTAQYLRMYFLFHFDFSRIGFSWKFGTLNWFSCISKWVLLKNWIFELTIDLSIWVQLKNWFSFCFNGFSWIFELKGLAEELDHWIYFTVSEMGSAEKLNLWIKFLSIELNCWVCHLSVELDSAEKTLIELVFMLWFWATICG